MARKKKAASPPTGGGLGSFGDLLAKAGMDLPDPAPETAPGPAPIEEGAWPRRVVVRRTRKGRGGKTVTLVEAALHGEWVGAEVTALKKALGTGAKHVPEGIVVQGDVGDRVADWLAARGVVEIVRGS